MLTMPIWDRWQVAERQCRQPANVQELQGSLREGQARAMTPPAQHRMQQQSLEVVALGVPALQRMQEPVVGFAKQRLLPRACGCY